MPVSLSRILLVLGLLITGAAVATAVVFSHDRSAGGAPPTRRSAAVTTAAPTRPAASATVTAAAAGATPGPPVSGSATRAPSALRGSVTVRAADAVNVRSGPGLEFPVITHLPVDEPIQATGRNPDGSWLLIETPSGSGWVAASVVTVAGVVTSLPVAEAEPQVSPTATTPARSTATATATATATRGATASAGGLPDLVLQDASVGAAGHLTLIIANTGPGALSGRSVRVTGVDEDGNTLFTETTAPLTIPAGGAVNVELGFRVARRTTMTVTINSGGAVDEVSTANDSRQVTLTP